MQFTPDLLPSDVTGVTIYDQSTGQFQFHPGPIFANIVLGDEINRASPKTQSALLEVMEEHQVTVDGNPYPVPRPFLVLATQNPVDMDGTYQLPEAQLDRFLIRTNIGYPDLDARCDPRPPTGSAPLDDLAPVLPGDHVDAMIRIARELHVARRGAALRGRDRRGHPHAAPGPPRRQRPRAASPWSVRAAWARPSGGRRYVAPEDVKAMAVAVLSHRLLLDAETQGYTQAALVQQVLDAVPPPPPPRDGGSLIVAEPVRSRRLPLTARGRTVLVAAVVLVVVGWLLGYLELIVFAIAAVVAVAIGLVSLVRRPQLEVFREIHPDRVGVGRARHRPRPRPQHGHPSDARVRRARALRRPAGRRRDPQARSGAARRSVTYRLPTARRGVVAVGPLAMGRSDALGIVAGDARTPARSSSSRTWCRWCRWRRPAARPRGSTSTDALGRATGLPRPAGVRARRRPASRALALVGPGDGLHR